MSTKRVTAGRWALGTAVLLGAVLAIQVAAATAAPETIGQSQVVAQVPTPTPFRFVAPTQAVPRTTTTTTTTSSSTSSATRPPSGGGFPMELALPVLVGGLTALGGGTYLLRRRPDR